MSTLAPITMFNAFIAALAAHDWHYDQSSDQKAWRRGRDSYRDLNSEANLNENYRAAFTAYISAAFDAGTSLLDRIEKREKTIDALRNKVLEEQLTTA